LHPNGIISVFVLFFSIIRRLWCMRLTPPTLRYPAPASTRRYHYSRLVLLVVKGPHVLNSPVGHVSAALLFPHGVCAGRHPPADAQHLLPPGGIFMIVFFLLFKSLIFNSHYHFVLQHYSSLMVSAPDATHQPMPSTSCYAAVSLVSL